VSEEYIKKADMERILYSTNNAVRIGELFMELPTYSIPGTAAPGEYIKKSDALRIASITTLSVDQVVSTIKALSTYSFPDSAENKSEWIPVEGIKDVPKAGTYWVTKHYGDNDYVINLKWYCNCWCDECDRPFYYTELEGITAYMPYMPEPYKGESEGTE
jgi:hypothetical protein